MKHMMLLLFLIFINFLEIQSNELIETISYVPLGYHHSFPCEIALSPGNALITKARWRISKIDEFGILHEFPVNTTEARRRGQRFYYKEFTKTGKYDPLNNIYQPVQYQKNDFDLYGFALQRVHDDLLLECYIELADDRGVLASRARIVIQDCSGDDNSLNRRNPCHYGKCIVKNAMSTNHFEYVECLCMPQYTGTFCDVPIQSAIYWTLFYYSPLIALLLLLGFVSACYTIFEGPRTVRPLSLEKHLPIGDRWLTLRKLYPASYVRPEDIPELLDETCIDD